MQKVKRRVLQALAVPLLLIGSLVALQSPAQAAVCAPEGRHVAFLPLNGAGAEFQRNCSGEHRGNGFLFQGYRGRYWSGWFSYSCPPNLPIGTNCSGGSRTFCDWAYVDFPTTRVWDPFTGTYYTYQVHYALDALYLNATKPASCP
jgi:hypothetical protein